jgi:hypothetical protein
MCPVEYGWRSCRVLNGRTDLGEELRTSSGVVNNRMLRAGASKTLFPRRDLVEQRISAE